MSASRTMAWVARPIALRRPRLPPVAPGLVLAWLVILLGLLWALLPWMFTDYSGTVGTAGQQLHAPNAAHGLGTDQIGRDVYARIVYGARQSLSAAFVAVTVGLLAGAWLGLLAGSLGGWIDDAIMRLMDMLLAIPALLL